MGIHADAPRRRDRAHGHRRGRYPGPSRDLSVRDVAAGQYALFLEWRDALRITNAELVEALVILGERYQAQLEGIVADEVR